MLVIVGGGKDSKKVPGRQAATRKVYYEFESLSWHKTEDAAGSVVPTFSNSCDLSHVQ